MDVPPTADPERRLWDVTDSRDQKALPWACHESCSTLAVGS